MGWWTTLNKNDMNGANKAIIFSAFGFIAVVVLVIPLSIAYTLFQNNTNFVLGTTGFFQEIVWRVVLTIVAVTVLVVCLVKAKNAEHIVAVLGYVLVDIICVVISFFLLRALVLDIPYLDHPETTYLNNIRFDDDTIGDGPASYYVQGTGIEGDWHSFDIGSKAYNEGRELWHNNFDLRAKVRYLPYTNVVMTVEFIDSIDDDAYALFPSQLSDDWHSFSIEICDKVYSVPLPLSDFLNDGWVLEDEYVDYQLEGADEPYEEYDEMAVDLTNEDGKEITVRVCNATDKAIDISEGTVGQIYVTYENLDFAGADLQIPGGLMLGWSTRADVKSTYGSPDENLEELAYKYADKDGATSFYRLGFSDEGFLHDIQIRNFPYRRAE